MDLGGAARDRGRPEASPPPGSEPCEDRATEARARHGVSRSGSAEGVARGGCHRRPEHLRPGWLVVGSDLEGREREEALARIQAEGLVAVQEDIALALDERLEPPR